MTINADQLAALLANRLSEIVPAGFEIAANDGIIQYSGNSSGSTSGTHVRANIHVFGESDEENAIGVGIRALDELQDFIAEATSNPWPGVSRQPHPHGEIRGPFLYLWYGDPDDVVLACRPIRVSEFTH